jgi:hypothetical protein
VDGGISAGERKDAAAKTDKPRQTLRCKIAFIQELSKYFAICFVIGHISQRNDNGEESQYMDDQNKSF